MNWEPRNDSTKNWIHSPIRVWEHNSAVWKKWKVPSLDLVNVLGPISQNFMNFIQSHVSPVLLRYHRQSVISSSISSVPLHLPVQQQVCSIAMIVGMNSTSKAANYSTPNHNAKNLSLSTKASLFNNLQGPQKWWQPCQISTCRAYCLHLTNVGNPVCAPLCADSSL